MLVVLHLLLVSIHWTTLVLELGVGVAGVVLPLVGYYNNVSPELLPGEFVAAYRPASCW